MGDGSQPAAVHARRIGWAVLVTESGHDDGLWRQLMTTARQIMTEGADCVLAADNLVEVSRRLRDLHVGALPVCGEDSRLQGVITDRDIVVRCVAEGGDPRTQSAQTLCVDDPVTVGAGEEIEEVLRTMAEHGLRRLPVIDDGRLVGMVTQVDVATHLSAPEVADLLRLVASAPYP